MKATDPGADAGRSLTLSGILGANAAGPSEGLHERNPGKTPYHRCGPQRSGNRPWPAPGAAGSSGRSAPCHSCREKGRLSRAARAAPGRAAADPPQARGCPRSAPVPGARSSAAGHRGEPPALQGRSLRAPARQRWPQPGAAHRPHRRPLSGRARARPRPRAVRAQPRSPPLAEHGERRRAAARPVPPR